MVWIAHGTGTALTERVINLFSTGKIKKFDFWDSNDSTNFKHQ